MSRSPDYDTPVEDMSVPDLIENAITMQKAAVFEMSQNELLAENVRLGAATNGDNEPQRWNYVLMVVDSGIPNLISQHNAHDDIYRAWCELIRGDGREHEICEHTGLQGMENAFPKGIFSVHKTEYRIHTLAWEGEE